jgi:hypothetical protein
MHLTLNINDLPLEIIEHITGYLDTIPSIMSFRAVCKYTTRINNLDFQQYYMWKCFNSAVYFGAPLSTLQWLIENNARINESAIEIGESVGRDRKIMLFLIQQYRLKKTNLVR